MQTHSCPQCGKKTGATANFCQHCGIALKKKSATKTGLKKGRSNHHAWRRYFARMIDLFSLSFVFGLLVGAVWPMLVDQAHILVLGIFLGIILIAYDTLCLSQWGTTFGKWLLGISVQGSSGRLMHAKKALLRGWLVFFRGLGLGLPIVSLFTMLHQYRVLRKTGSTSWDKQLGVTLHYKALHPVKVGVAAVIIFFFVSLATAGSVG